eukprot:2513950-Prymnesium_polylepis.1
MLFWLGVVGDTDPCNDQLDKRCAFALSPEIALAAKRNERRAWSTHRTELERLTAAYHRSCITPVVAATRIAKNTLVPRSVHKSSSLGQLRAQRTPRHDAALRAYQSQ